MKHVHDLETSSLSEEEKGKHSSYDPAEYIPCVHNASTETKTQQGASDSRDKGAGSSEAMVNDCVRCCRYLPAHYFDYVGGTSTGGLISIMLGRLRMSVDDCMREYETLSETIFRASSSHIGKRSYILAPRQVRRRQNSKSGRRRHQQANVASRT